MSNYSFGLVFILSLPFFWCLLIISQISFLMAATYCFIILNKIFVLFCFLRDNHGEPWADDRCNLEALKSTTNQLARALHTLLDNYPTKTKSPLLCCDNTLNQFVILRKQSFFLFFILHRCLGWGAGREGGSHSCSRLLHIKDLTSEKTFARVTTTFTSESHFSSTCTFM